MNEFLRTRKQVDVATKYLQDNGLIESGISCKNWEIAQVIPFMKDGNWLDMGSDGSVVLPNLVKKNIVGMKVGIDLAYPENVVSPEGTNLMKGDLMNTGLPDSLFDFIVSLSTIEHQVEYGSFAKEVGRLLKKGGNLFLSFDYWPIPIDTSLTKLYSLDWNILSKDDVISLIDECGKFGLMLSGDIDWTVQDAVINDKYCSPAKGVAYTFSILNFIKQ